MRESLSKPFDCVQSVRQIRDQLSTEIVDMSYEELAQWFRSHKYSEPTLQRLADKAAQQANVADAGR